MVPFCRLVVRRLLPTAEPAKQKKPSESFGDDGLGVEWSHEHAAQPDQNPQRVGGRSATDQLGVARRDRSVSDGTAAAKSSIVSNTPSDLWPPKRWLTDGRHYTKHSVVQPLAVCWKVGFPQEA